MPRPRRHPREPELARAIGKAIRVARRRIGMKAEILAYECGVTAQSVSFWETGKAVPTLPNLLTACEKLGLPMSTLIRGAEMALRLDATMRADAARATRGDEEEDGTCEK